MAFVVLRNLSKYKLMIDDEVINGEAKLGFNTADTNVPKLKKLHDNRVIKILSIDGVEYASETEIAELAKTVAEAPTITVSVEDEAKVEADTHPVPDPEPVVEEKVEKKAPRKRG